MDDETLGKTVKNATIVTGIGLASAGLSTLGGMGGAYIDGQKPLPNHELSVGDAAVERIIDQRYSTQPNGPNGTFSNEQAIDEFKKQQSSTELQNTGGAVKKELAAEVQQILAEEKIAWDEREKAKNPVQIVSVEEPKDQKSKDLDQYRSEKAKVNAERAKEVEEVKTYNALRDTAENTGRGAGAALPLGVAAGMAWSAREQRKAELKAQHKSVVTLG